MTPNQYASQKLELWKQALHEQRDAEAALAAARRKKRHELILSLIPQVEFLRTKADLLLADAVKARCLLDDEPFLASEWMITAPDASSDGSDHEDDCGGQS